MARSTKVEVTPKMLEALEELRQTVSSLPAGEARARAEAAVAHLTRSFAGGAEPALERKCPPATSVIRN